MRRARAVGRQSRGEVGIQPQREPTLLGRQTAGPVRQLQRHGSAIDNELELTRKPGRQTLHIGVAFALRCHTVAIAVSPMQFAERG